MKKLINSLLISASILLTACGVGTGNNTSTPVSTNSFNPRDGHYYTNVNFGLLVESGLIKKLIWIISPTQNVHAQHNANICMWTNLQLPKSKILYIEADNCVFTESSISFTLQPYNKRFTFDYVEFKQFKQTNK